MADLTDNASPTKIIGADSGGAETNYVDATTKGLKVDPTKALEKQYLDNSLAIGATYDLDVTNFNTVRLHLDRPVGATDADNIVSVTGSFDGITFGEIVTIFDEGTEGEFLNGNQLNSADFSFAVGGFKALRFTSLFATDVIGMKFVLNHSNEIVRGIQGRVYTSLVNSQIGAEVLFTAPVADTGQGALAVRVISDLSGGGGGGGSGTVTIADYTTPSQKAAVDATGALKVDSSNFTQPVSGTFWQATQPVSASALPLPTGAATDSTLTNGNQKTRISDFTGNVIDSTLDGANRGLNVHLTNNTSIATSISGSVAVTGTFWQSTQPVSIAASVAVTGPLTDTQLRASAVPVSQSGTWNISNISGTISLPTGAALASKQPALGVAGTASNDVLSVQGIAGMTALKVDASATVQPVSQNGNWAITNITGTVSLPTGAATESTLSTMSGKLPATIGAKTIAASMAVNIASDQTVPTSNTQLPSSLGTKTIANSMAVNVASDQIVNVALNQRSGLLYKGRANTFRTPGLAGSAGQKLMSIHNATGSTITVKVNKVYVDLMQTVIKAVTTAPPIIRLWKVTVLPTNGTAMTKVQIDGSSASSSSVTVLQGASSDGTASGTALTATLPSGTIIAQEFAPRMITAAGYEMADRIMFLEDTEVKLGALEGLVVFLDYSAAGQNPITDMWIGGIEWSEY